MIAVVYKKKSQMTTLFYKLKVSIDWGFNDQSIPLHQDFKAGQGPYVPTILGLIFH